MVVVYCSAQISGRSGAYTIRRANQYYEQRTPKSNLITGNRRARPESMLALTIADANHDNGDQPGHAYKPPITKRKQHLYNEDTGAHKER